MKLGIKVFNFKYPYTCIYIFIYFYRKLLLLFENSMERGAWWATVHRLTMSQTQLSD